LFRAQAPQRELVRPSKPIEASVDVLSITTAGAPRCYVTAASLHAATAFSWHMRTSALRQWHDNDTDWTPSMLRSWPICTLRTKQIAFASAGGLPSGPLLHPFIVPRMILDVFQRSTTLPLQYQTSKTISRPPYRLSTFLSYSRPSHPDRPSETNRNGSESFLAQRVDMFRVLN
jgi:hypothetical protein